MFFHYTWSACGFRWNDYGSKDSLQWDSFYDIWFVSIQMNLRYWKSCLYPKAVWFAFIILYCFIKVIHQKWMCGENKLNATLWSRIRCTSVYYVLLRELLSSSIALFLFYDVFFFPLVSFAVFESCIHSLTSKSIHTYISHSLSHNISSSLFSLL